MGVNGLPIKRKAKKVLRFFLIVLAAVVVFFLIGTLFRQLGTTAYTVPTDKVEHPIRIVLLTDIHSCKYGEKQTDLVRAVEAANPDIICMAGDILDDKLPHERAVELLDGLNGRWPVYYVTGNHEWWSGDMDEIKQLLRGYGVVVLEGGRQTAEVNGQRIDICGIDDPAGGEGAWQAQLESTLGGGSENFTVFLSHRPERFPQYCEYEFDLALCGHAHGGQLRVPGIRAGLFAPNQGFFPKYNAGEYWRDGREMILSRGLSRESSSWPRFYNPPEVVVVDVVPEG